MQARHERIYNVGGDSINVGISSIELYGFMFWILTALLAILYTLWAIVPIEIMHDLGIHYIPDKYYLLALANWFGVTYYLAHFISYAWYMTLCHPKDSYFTL